MAEKHSVDTRSSSVSDSDISLENDDRNVQTRATDGFLHSWQLGLVTFSLSLGTFLVALDINIIGVAVPKITSVFNSLEDAAWYAAAYLLPVTALQPTMGYLYKVFNVRFIYFTSLLVFEAGSLLCAIAPSSIALILGRALAGVGAAGLLQGALAVITLIVKLERRPLFMSIVISVFGVSVCVGPVLGGAFVQDISWRWCFWINLPIGALAVILLATFLRIRVVDNNRRQSTTSQKLSQMDYAGTLTFAGAFICLTLALQWGGQTKPWSSSTIIGLLVAFGVLSVSFVASQIYRGDKALIPPRIFAQRSILVGSTFLFFIGMFNYTYSFYLPFYFQAVQLVAPTDSGVRIIPFVLTTIIAIGLTGAAVTRWGFYVPYMILGSVVASIGAGLVTRFDVATPDIEWIMFLIVAGVGLGVAQQIPYTAGQVVLSKVDVAVGNALFVFSNQLGGIVALPIAQSIWLASLRKEVISLTPNIDPNKVIASGAASLQAMAGQSIRDLLGLRTAYAHSLTRPFYLALASLCVATAISPFMEWKNIKHEARERNARSENTVDDRRDEDRARVGS